jgi:pilus assembly protein CpaB
VNTRRITLIIAVVLAVGTGILTLRYLSTLNQQTQQAAVEMKTVVTTNADIPARGKITADMLTIVKRPATDVEPGSLDDPKQAEGDVALISMPANTVLTTSNIGTPAAVGLTVRLKPGMRAISIPVDKVKSVSGLMQPGDRVDVLASVNKGPGVPPKTFTIIRGALVLALNSTLEAAPEQAAGATPPPADASGGVGTVTLGVTPAQADLLTVADINTTLRLALRSPEEPVRSLPEEKLVFADLGSVPAAPAAPAFNVPPPLQPAPAPQAPVDKPVTPIAPLVTVIDGDKVISGK